MRKTTSVLLLFTLMCISSDPNNELLAKCASGGCNDDCVMIKRWADGANPADPTSYKFYLFDKEVFYDTGCHQRAKEGLKVPFDMQIGAEVWIDCSRVCPKDPVCEWTGGMKTQKRIQDKVFYCQAPTLPGQPPEE